MAPRRVETSRDRRQKTLLAFDVGGDGPEHRRLFLVGAVGAAESLDRGIGAPAGLQQIMDALSLVLAREIGVIAAPGAAGIGEDRMRLSSSMKAAVSAKLAEAGRVSTQKRSSALDDAARAAGDFGDKIGAEAVQDLIERALHRRQ